MLLTERLCPLLHSAGRAGAPKSRHFKLPPPVNPGGTLGQSICRSIGPQLRRAADRGGGSEGDSAGCGHEPHNFGEMRVSLLASPLFRTLLPVAPERDWFGERLSPRQYKTDTSGGFSLSVRDG